MNPDGRVAGHPRQRQRLRHEPRLHHPVAGRGPRGARPARPLRAADHDRPARLRRRARSSSRPPARTARTTSTTSTSATRCATALPWRRRWSRTTRRTWPRTTAARTPPRSSRSATTPTAGTTGRRSSRRCTPCSTARSAHTVEFPLNPRGTTLTQAERWNRTRDQHQRRPLRHGRQPGVGERERGPPARRPDRAVPPRRGGRALPPDRRPARARPGQRPGGRHRQHGDAAPGLPARLRRARGRGAAQRDRGRPAGAVPARQRRGGLPHDRAGDRSAGRPTRPARTWWTCTRPSAAWPTPSSTSARTSRRCSRPCTTSPPGASPRCGARTSTWSRTGPCPRPGSPPCRGPRPHRQRPDRGASRLPARGRQPRGRRGGQPAARRRRRRLAHRGRAVPRPGRRTRWSGRWPATSGSTSSPCGRAACRRPTPVQTVRVGAAAAAEEVFALRSMGFDVTTVTTAGFNAGTYAFSDFDALYVEQANGLNPTLLTGAAATGFAAFLAEGGTVVGQGAGGVTFNTRAALLPVAATAARGDANGIVAVTNDPASPITGGAVEESFVSSPRYFSTVGRRRPGRPAPRGRRLLPRRALGRPGGGGRAAGRGQRRRRRARRSPSSPPSRCTAATRRACSRRSPRRCGAGRPEHAAR